MNVQQVKEKVNLLREVFRISMDFLDQMYEQMAEDHKYRTKVYSIVENRRAEIIQCISQCIGHYHTEHVNIEVVLSEIEIIKFKLMEDLETVRLEEMEQVA